MLRSDGVRRASIHPPFGSVGSVGCLIVLLAAVPAQGASGVSFVEAYRSGAAGIESLRAPISVAVSPDGANVYAAANADDAVVVFERDPLTGRLSFVEAQRDGLNGVHGLRSAVAVAVSADGKNVYAGGNTDNSVVVFSRRAPTGALSLVEVQQNETGGVDGLAGVAALQTTLDGRSVYAVGRDDDAVVMFSRDGTTGALNYVGLARDGVDGVAGLAAANDVAVSPDGASVYVSGGSNDGSVGFGAVAAFRRDPLTGILTFIAAYSGANGVPGLFEVDSVTVSPDGAHVYAASNGDDAVVVFERDAQTGSLRFVATEGEDNGVVDGASSVRVSPNGFSVYVSARGFYANALVVFDRDSTSGRLSLVEVHRHGLAEVDGLDFPAALAVSPGGVHVYTAGRNDDALGLFRLRLDAPTATPTASVTLTRTETISPTPSISITPGGPTLTPTASATPTFTPTSCVGSGPRVDPVTSPTDLLIQTITGLSAPCFRADLSVSGVELVSLTRTCPSGSMFAATVRLRPNQTNHVSVCHIPLACGRGGCTTVDIVQQLTTPSPALTPSATPTVTATPSAAVCAGDCSGMQTVAVDDVIILVKVALGNAAPSTCPHGIPRGRAVDVALLIQAVRHALTGCPSTGGRPPPP